MKRRLLSVLLSCLLLSSCAAAEECITLTALNVGKGDCLLLQSRETLYMIDTAKAENWGLVSNALKQLNITRLDGVIVTHTDGDHAGGAWALAMSGIEVGGWYAPQYYSGVKEKKHPVKLAAALRNEKVTWLKAGDTLPFGGASLTVIGPRSYNEKENCNSLVLLAEGGGGRMLLAGDMEFPEEQELLEAGVIPKCQVLKIGNHGEDDATSEALVSQVQPEIAMISTDTSVEPDTPSDRVMSLLAKYGVTVYQTQDTPLGYVATLRGGQVQVSTLSGSNMTSKVQTVKIKEKNAKEDVISIINQGGEAVDMDGWYIYSEKGKELFVFSGTVLEPGQTLTIASLSSSEKGDLTWPDENVWHKSKKDRAFLYDGYGRLIDEMD